MTRHALEFFQTYLPFWEMQPDNGLASGGSSPLVLARPGNLYAVYLPNGGTANLDVDNTEAAFSIQWYDPRNGGELQDGTVTQVLGPGPVSVGLPPSNPNQDWVVLVRVIETGVPAARYLLYGNAVGARPKKR
jgi:hypothetical protein